MIGGLIQVVWENLLYTNFFIKLSIVLFYEKVFVCLWSLFVKDMIVVLFGI